MYVTVYYLKFYHNLKTIEKRLIKFNSKQYLFMHKYFCTFICKIVKRSINKTDLYITCIIMFFKTINYKFFV